MISNQSESFQQIEHTPISEISPDDITKTEMSESKQIVHSPVKTFLRCNIKRCMLLILLVISSSILIYQVNTQGKVIDPKNNKDLSPYVSKYQYLVFCPQSYVTYPDGKKSDDQLRRRLYEKSIKTTYKDQKVDKSKVYVVEIKSLKSQDGQNFLAYCGFVRQYYGNCSDTKYICSSPGPMFDLQVNQHADIVWVNLVNSSIYINKTEDDQNQCLLNHKDACKLPYKHQNRLSETFQDPTMASMDQKHSVSRITISPKNWPISTHVHGAQVRPTFDGNPISWIDNTGLRGLGAFSLNEECYYDQFSQFGDQGESYAPPKTVISDLEGFGSLETAKINRYPNRQNPGNLWYHDHAMRLTNYNVRNGLSGLYILRDRTLEPLMGVNRMNQKLVMMSVGGWQMDHLTKFEEKTVYRLRLLNNFFQNFQVFILSFSYNSCTDQLKDRVKFTIIGADSSLFHEGIYNQTFFQIGQAERMEILVKFLRIPNKETTVSVCSGGVPLKIDPKTKEPIQNRDQKLYIIKTVTLEYQQNGRSKYQNSRTQIDNVKFPIPYTSFSEVSDKRIAVKRMRPLMFTDMMMINGRYDFHVGKSQNPVIGTYEDWFMINTMSLDHPIHIHLINFQVVKQFQLLYFNHPNPSQDDFPQCTFYQLDFYAEAIVKSSKLSSKQKQRYVTINKDNTYNVNYYNLCIEKSGLYANNSFFKNDLLLVNVQDEKDSNNISGINLLKSITKQFSSDLKRLEQEYNAKHNNFRIFPSVSVMRYQYVSNEGMPSAKPYYRRWKDTAIAKGLMAYQFRIRWTKSQFNQSNPLDPFFHVPADQLRQYPGYVYHCHILHHEDHEMMRPIMLQLPNQSGILDHNLKCNQGNTGQNWKTKFQCINKQCDIPNQN